MQFPYFKPLTSAAIILSTILTAGCAVQGQQPAATQDGLKLVSSTETSTLYEKPDVDFSTYKAVMLADTRVAFKKFWRSDRTVHASPMAIRTTKENLAKYMNEELQKTLTAAGYKVVTEPANDVLLIQPAIVNLDIEAIDDLKASVSLTYSQTPGEMTVSLRLFDSVTNDLLSSYVDTESGQDYNIMFEQNAVTNAQGAKVAIDKWAGALLSQLKPQ